MSSSFTSSQPHRMQLIKSKCTDKFYWKELYTNSCAHCVKLMGKEFKESCRMIHGDQLLQLERLIQFTLPSFIVKVVMTTDETNQY